VALRKISRVVSHLAYLKHPVQDKKDSSQKSLIASRLAKPLISLNLFLAVGTARTARHLLIQGTAAFVPGAALRREGRMTLVRRLDARAMLTGLMLLAIVSIGSAAAADTTTPPQAPPQSAPRAEQTIKGSVLNIEGEFVVLKDISGHEVRLHVDKHTRMDRLKVGDTVEAQVKSDGHAESVMVQLPQSR
jgi:hypothetical protein